MSDAYQAVYDATRNSIRNGDIGSAVENVMLRENIGHQFQMATSVIAEQFYGYSAPSAVYRPTLTQDGNAWLAVYGDLPTGVVGCGDTPGEAMRDFDKAWFKSASATKAA